MHRSERDRCTRVVIPAATSVRRHDDLTRGDKLVAKGQNVRVYRWWWRVSIAEVGSDDERDEGMRTKKETRRSMGHGCPKTLARNGRNWADLPHANRTVNGYGLICLLFSEAGRCYLYDEGPTQRNKYATF